MPPPEKQPDTKKPDTSPPSQGQSTPAKPPICADDVAVDESMALLFSEEAPLPVTEAIQKARGTRTKDDYKAVWSWVPEKPETSVLIFFHGNHHYVTVDKLSKPTGAAPPDSDSDKEKDKKKKKKKKEPGPTPPSRIPDWAEPDSTAKSAITDPDGMPAVGIFYKLDELNAEQGSVTGAANAIKLPVELVPEDVELTTGNDWAAPPKKQYTDPDRLKRLGENCYEHLRCLKKPSGSPYLASTKDQSGPSYVKNLKRIYLCGHSGGGKPMLECAAANIALAGDPPIDFWLFDATYGWGTAGYVTFCKTWQDLKKLGNSASASRFVCIYKYKYKVLQWEDKKHTIATIDPKTNKQAFAWGGTEMEADDLRDKIAAVVKKKAADIWLEHKKDDKTGDDNLFSDIVPALEKSPVLFVRTFLEHEDIPKVFIPVLLRTAAS